MPVSKEKWDKVVELISNGKLYKHACAIAGVGESTFYDKKKNDPEFLEAIKKADAEYIAHHEQFISDSPQWTAHAWLLERKFPQIYKEQKKIEHEGIDIKISDAGKGGA